MNATRVKRHNSHYSIQDPTHIENWDRIKKCAEHVELVTNYDGGIKLEGVNYTQCYLVIINGDAQYYIVEEQQV